MSAEARPLPVVRQLQDAIRASGLSLQELGRRAGVSQGQLSRFLRGDRTLTLPAAARLCLYFRLGLRPDEGSPALQPASDVSDTLATKPRSTKPSKPRKCQESVG
jgi:transcriptional regulator with XRE-family HTH domain